MVDATDHLQGSEWPKVQMPFGISVGAAIVSFLVWIPLEIGVDAAKRMPHL